MSITTTHSLWLAPLCLALGMALAWWLYGRERGAEGMVPRLRLLLGIVRALAVALIAFFLLEPMLRMMTREVRKPVVVLLHDGSASLALAGDTAALRTRYADALRALEQDLGRDLQVRAFTYGDGLQDGLSFKQDGQVTDLAQALREVNDRFGGPDLAAVIVDGDGIVNRGRDPRLDAERLQVPVHTIALGDTTVRPDLAVKGVDHNRISFLGNEFPVRARIGARHLKGRRTRVALKRGTEELAAQELPVPTDPFLQEVAFAVKANKAGTQRYTVEVAALEEEAVLVNNRFDFYIEVLDARQKVLLLAAAPHPDLAALRQALAGVEGYAVELGFAGSAPVVPEGYDLIVLHQLPGLKADAAGFIERARAKGIPMLHVLGQGTRFEAFNALQAGVRVSDARNAITDAQAAAAKDFSLFNVEPDLAQALERFPPLQVPFGQYALGRSAHALAWQRVGVVRTEAPLIAVSQLDGQRSAMICGEGLWRWRLADHQLFGSHERFDRLIRKLVQFLALKSDKKRLRVEHPPIVPTNEPLVFTAELYNAAYEQVPDAEITITLKDDEGRAYPFAFAAGARGYRASAGLLPAGHYTWEAVSMHQGERLTATGEAHVQAVALEQVSTVADHALLADIAARTGGTLLLPDELASLPARMKADRSTAARSYAQPRFTDLIEARWLFLPILLLLAVEWSLRRRSGHY